MGDLWAPDAMETLEDAAAPDLTLEPDVDAPDVPLEDLPEASPDAVGGGDEGGDGLEWPSEDLPERLCGQAVGDEALQELCEDSDCQKEERGAFCGEELCGGESCVCEEGEACSELCSNGDGCGVSCEQGALCGLESAHLQVAWLSCGQEASCHHSCRQVGSCSTTCEAGSSCEAVCQDNTSCSMVCEEGSRCAMLCTGSGDCRLQCKNGAHCTLILVNDEGQLDCNGPDRVQLCDRPGVSTCRQACPE